MCRSRRELSNEHLLAKIGVDTAENEPLEGWGKNQFIIHLPPQVRASRTGPAHAERAVFPVFTLPRTCMGIVLKYVLEHEELRVAESGRRAAERSC